MALYCGCRSCTTTLTMSLRSPRRVGSRDTGPAGHVSPHSARRGMSTRWPTKGRQLSRRNASAMRWRRSRRPSSWRRAIQGCPSASASPRSCSGRTIRRRPGSSGASSWIPLRGIFADARRTAVSRRAHQGGDRHVRICVEAIAGHAAAGRAARGVAQGNALQDRFYESRGAHFSVLFEGPADEALARRIVERLEPAYWRVGVGADRLSPKADHRRPLHHGTVPRRHTPAGLDRCSLRRPHPPAGARRLRAGRPARSRAVSRVRPRGGGDAWGTQRADMAQRRAGQKCSNRAAWNAERVLARSRVTAAAARICTAASSDLSAVDAAVAYAFSARAVQRMIDLRGAPAVVQLLQDLARGGGLRRRIPAADLDAVRGFSVDGGAPVTARQLSTFVLQQSHQRLTP